MSAYSKHGSTHTYRSLYNQSQMPIKQYKSLKAHYFESPVNYKNTTVPGSSSNPSADGCARILRQQLKGNGDESMGVPSEASSSGTLPAARLHNPAPSQRAVPPGGWRVKHGLCSRDLQGIRAPVPSPARRRGCHGHGSCHRRGHGAQGRRVRPTCQPGGGQTAWRPLHISRFEK